MGKEYTLPWTCKQGELIKAILKCILLFGSTVLSIYLYYKHNAFFIVFTVFIIIGIVIQLGKWADEDRLPSFKCKCDEDSKR